MIIYWIMFALPAICALFEQSRQDHRFSLVWLCLALSLAVLIGFRWETGGDWINYKMMVEDAGSASSRFSLLSDPGFELILRIAAGSSLGILLVTIISGIVMGFALVRFCLDQPRPWLALAVAVPYFVVVMGMGYIRQGMAISCWMMGMLSIRDRKLVGYCLWVLLGAAFHSTSLILLPLGPLAATRSLAIRTMLGVLTLGVLVYGLESTRAEDLVTGYVQAGMSSSGTVIRLLMTALPATIFLIFRERFRLERVQTNIWTLMSSASLLGLAAIAVSPSSTVVDRLCLYLLPIHSFLYSRIPNIFGQDDRNRRLVVLAILAGYLAVFFVWLNFAVNSWAWLPYRFYFFEDSACLEC